jgi:hypothetical protein
MESSENHQSKHFRGWLNSYPSHKNNQPKQAMTNSNTLHNYIFHYRGISVRIIVYIILN